MFMLIELLKLFLWGKKKKTEMKSQDSYFMSLSSLLENQETDLMAERLTYIKVESICRHLCGCVLNEECLQLYSTHHLTSGKLSMFSTRFLLWWTLVRTCVHGCFKDSPICFRLAAFASTTHIFFTHLISPELNLNWSDSKLGQLCLQVNCMKIHHLHFA